MPRLGQTILAALDAYWEEVRQGESAPRWILSVESVEHDPIPHQSSWDLTHTIPAPAPFPLSTNLASHSPFRGEVRVFLPPPVGNAGGSSRNTGLQSAKTDAAHETPSPASPERRPQQSVVPGKGGSDAQTLLIPRAIRYGWPTRIDFDFLPERIRKLQPALNTILANPTSSTFFCNAVAEIARLGKNVAESAAGQYLTFENLQPGYYGERGGVVINLTLLKIYPPETLLRALKPLSMATVMQAVLIPEVALALIADDFTASRNRASAIMKRSSKYGSQMFPDDDELGNESDEY
ncbi:hypothetical protein AURDEDRAFT_124045 [Auricularia subglabra TFB-10046 SS5]|nr:hypothetical protein AURDEDRAFT_124045 [Auricularia subglabra TFB-10046 SS5]